MTRDALIEAGVRALQDVWADSGDGPSVRELAAAVVDAVEPLIRADLRDRVETLGGPFTSGSEFILRADVLALLDGSSDE